MRAPEIDRTEISGKSVVVYWKRVPNRNDIANYELELEAVSKTTIKSFKTKNGVINSHTFNNLDKDDVYIVRVRAITKNGEKTDWTGKTISLKHGKKKLDFRENTILKRFIIFTAFRYIRIFNELHFVDIINQSDPSRICLFFYSNLKSRI